VAKPLKVDPVDLSVASDHLVVAAQTAAATFAEHVSELAEAESGWVGESRHALREFAAALADKHAADVSAANALSESMSEAAIEYAGTDIDRSEVIARLAEAMGI
jgi:predicted DsbA family dithiol-disulfide isomerase